MTASAVLTTVSRLGSQQTVGVDGSLVVTLSVVPETMLSYVQSAERSWLTAASPSSYSTLVATGALALDSTTGPPMDGLR